jgi:tetratricopeptide (TPR) repeat protein
MMLPHGRAFRALLLLALLGSVAQCQPADPTGPSSAPGAASSTDTLGSTAAPSEQGEAPAELPQPGEIKKLIDAGEKEKALALLLKLDAGRPQDPFAMRKMLSVLLELERFEDALDRGHGGLKRFPKDALLLERLALASQRLAEKLARQPGQVSRAQLYLEDAKRFAQRAVAAAPDRRESLAIVGLAQFQLGEIQEALSTADRLTQRFGDSPSGPLLRAQIRLTMFTNGIRQERLEEKERFLLAGQIRRDCEMAARLDSTRHLPYRLLGDVALWLGENEEAFKQFAASMARDPGRGAPHDWIARYPVEDRLELYRDAIAAYQGRKHKEPRDEALLHWHFGLACFDAGDWEGTRAAMARCFGLRPEFLNTLYYGALASYEIRKPDEGLFFATVLSRKAPKDLIGSLENAGKQRSRYLEIFRFFAKRALDKGDAAASRDLNRCIAAVADDVDAWNNFAFLCRETGKHEEAWSAYQRALELDPEDPQLLNDAAVILQYYLKKDLPKAKAMYQRAIRNASALLKKKTGDPKRIARARQSMKDARGNLEEMAKAPKKDPGKKDPGKD